ncbi:MAG TPA: secretin N-terminal domain-containing protein [Pyrinomonadaceae bacterium]|jgi:type II secretory pathway component GspD/PulD (secretin)
MRQPGKRTFLALALLLLAAPAALAQSEAPRQEESYVTQKMFQSRVFDVKNRDPQSLVRVLAPLTSGFRGAVVSANPEFRTISVRDFAENIAVIEEAIRRLDTPEAARPSVEFRVHMLVASNDEAVVNRYPAELSDVVKQLQTSLGYKNFSLMGSQIVRGKEGRGDNYNRGVADLRMANDTPANKSPVYYSYNLSNVSLDGARVQVDQFSMEMRVPLWLGEGKIVYETVGFKNPVALREGERVVAGTTSIADKNVVVILTAKTQ